MDILYIIRDVTVKWTTFFKIIRLLNMTTSEAMAKTRQVLEERYANYWSLAPNERMLLAASVLADDFKVREEGENNHGEWIEAILGSVRLEEGYPWCAAFVEFCCDVAKFEQVGLSDRASAAVNEWYKWAKANGKLVTMPIRGDLCLWIKDSGNHIGIVSQASGGYVNSIEGNTTPGVTGNQRDGGGVYRRSRQLKSWTHFIRM